MDSRQCFQVSAGEAYDTGYSKVSQGEYTVYQIYCRRIKEIASAETQLQIVWSLPINDIVAMWYANCEMDRALKEDWSREMASMTALSAPVMAFYDAAGNNRYTFALSEVKKRVYLSAGVHGEDGTLCMRIRMPIQDLENPDYYEFKLRIDERAHPYYQALNDTVTWWEEELAIVPIKAAANAWKPMYSTWYECHQNLISSNLEEECKHAVALGMKTVIVDDGWQTSDNHRGYAYCGDWQVEKSKFPDMKEHVSRIHGLGMKYMVWFSVPFVGKNSLAWKRFSDKLLTYDQGQKAGVLDLRYPEVREYLAAIYENFMRDYDVDGLKLDFIDQFYLRNDSPKYCDGMDFVCVQDALDCLMTEVRRRVSTVKADAMIEFRQKYIGPNMRKYGDIFRVGDCPYSALSNKVGIIDLRLLSGETAVHSDMLMWHPEDRIESISQQILNCIFSVIQFSVNLQEMNQEQKTMLSWWISFMDKNQELLYHSQLRPLEPENLYPEVRAENETEAMIALYSANRAAVIETKWQSITILNAVSADSVIVDNRTDFDYKVVIRDCCGREIGPSDLHSNANQLNRFAVTVGGILELTKAPNNKAVETVNAVMLEKIAMSWEAPIVPADILHGDMPGDKVEIEAGHIEKANIIFRDLLKKLPVIIQGNPYERAVITVCGGSGVGKSEVASILSYYFNQLGVGSYTLSGDNYPHRIPQYNDAERLQIFREGGLRGMVRDGQYTKKRFEIIQKYEEAGDDANSVHSKEYSWYESFLKSGRNALRGYLGTTKEMGFDELTSIITSFKNGANHIWLKRMGRKDTELWYDHVDFSEVNILVIEWTHGNSDQYEGVDIPILLNSTPQETLAHRSARNRDGATDSPFTTMILELEQELLEKQAHKANIILSKNGEILKYEEYLKQMENSRKEGVNAQ